MKQRIALVLVMVLGLVLVLGQAATAQGPVGSQPRSADFGNGFTYQGQLTRNGSPVNATCAFTFSLFDSATGGTQLGTVGPQSRVVSNGIFTSDLLSFGTAALSGSVAYLQVSVSCPGDSSPTILPRQRLTPAPYAVYAANGPFWSLAGNSGTLPSSNFIGTTDGVTFTMRVSNTVGWRLAPTNGAVGTPNVIGGYSGNIISATVSSGTIGGGGFAGDPNRVWEDFATVGGGRGNTASGLDATVGGGEENSASAYVATVGGGGNNTASGSNATVGGGALNTASGTDATVGGGVHNTAAGLIATVPGGAFNSATMSYTLAAGYRAKANHDGVFVWGDSTDADFASTGTNQFLVRAGGGMGIVQSGTSLTPTAQLYVSSTWMDNRPQLQVNQSTASNMTVIRMTQAANYASRWDIAMVPDMFDIYSGKKGNDILKLTPNDVGTYLVMGNGAYLTAGGVWTNSSDRNLKTDFRSLDGREVLARLMRVPIAEWSYRAEDAQVRHIGPTAQDFHAAFGLGADDTHIGTVDADGVALAAIQGLNTVVQEKDATIKELQTQNAKLESQSAQQQAQIDALAKRLDALEQGQGLASAGSPPSLLDRAGLFGGLLIAAVAWGWGRRRG